MTTRGARAGSKRLPGWLLWLLPFWVSACVTPALEPGAQTYYVTPVISYLRECPEYNCRVVRELYQGEEVNVLARPVEEWWQLYAPRSGVTGWLPGSLLSPLPPPATQSYFLRAAVTLKDCPGQDCPGHKLLPRGEEVQKVEENGKGWWRVLTVKDKTLGWVPATQVAARPVSPAPAPAPEKGGRLFAVPPTLNLHALPLSDSAVVKVVNRNESVEKVAAADHDWLKVRHLPSGAEGWTRGSFLSASPLVAAEPTPRPRKARRKTHPKKTPEKAPAAEPPVRPEPM